MARNVSRGLNTSLRNGRTDGTVRKDNNDWELNPDNTLTDSGRSRDVTFGAAGIQRPMTLPQYPGGQS